MNKIPVSIFLNESVYNVKAFNRTKTAHHNADKILDNVAYNEVDSVVYIKNKLNLPANFVSGRKYSYVVECLSGTIAMEYNKCEDLEVIAAYDDLSDTEEFSGAGTKLILNQGEIAIFDLDEAVKYDSIDGQFIEYKVAKDGGIK